MTSSVRIDDLQKKYEQNPRRYFAPLANELRRGGDARRAVALCEAGLTADPTHLSGHVVLALALGDLGDNAGSERSFVRAVELDPENVIALRSLGDLARDRGDREAARSWYQHALEADPRDPELATRLATLDSESAVSPPSDTEAASDTTGLGTSDPRAVHAVDATDGGGVPVVSATGDNDVPVGSDAPGATGGVAATREAGDVGDMGEDAAVAPATDVDSPEPPSVSLLPSEELDREFQQQREAEEFTAGFFAAVLQADSAATVPATAGTSADAADTIGEMAESASELTSPAEVEPATEWTVESASPSEQGEAAGPDADASIPEWGPEPTVSEVPGTVVDDADASIPEWGPEPTASEVPGTVVDDADASIPEWGPEPTASEVPGAVVDDADASIPEWGPEPTVSEVPGAVVDDADASIPEWGPEPTASEVPGTVVDDADASIPEWGLEPTASEVPGAVVDPTPADLDASIPEWGPEPTVDAMQASTGDPAAHADLPPSDESHVDHAVAESPTADGDVETAGSALFESRESLPPEPGLETHLDRPDDSSVGAQWREEIPSARSRVEISTSMTDYRESPVVTRWSETVPAESRGERDVPAEIEPTEPSSAAAFDSAGRVHDFATEEESSRLPFVTVTMAKLLLQQGFRSDALQLFRQLAAQHPEDSTIRDQLSELEEELHPSGASGRGVTVGSWLRELARTRPTADLKGGEDSSPESMESGQVEPGDVASGPAEGEAVGGRGPHADGHAGPARDVATAGSDIVSGAAAAAASAVSWESGVPDPSIDEFLFSDDPLEWGEVMSPPAAPATAHPPAPAERASDLTLDELLGRPVAAEDEMAAGALASATLAMQRDQETDAQLAEAAAEDPGALEHLLAGPSTPESLTTRETGGFSFEQFFQVESTAGGVSEPGASPAAVPTGFDGPPIEPPAGAPAADEEAAAREADLADFHAWLAGLSKT